jgi:hypothetical protein
MQIPGWRGGDSAYRPGWGNEKGRAVFLMSDVTIRENLAGENLKGSLDFGLSFKSFLFIAFWMANLP